MRRNALKQALSPLPYRIGQHEENTLRARRKTPRLALIALNAVALIGGAWLLLAVFAAGYKFY